MRFAVGDLVNAIGLSLFQLLEIGHDLFQLVRSIPPCEDIRCVWLGIFRCVCHQLTRAALAGYLQFRDQGEIQRFENPGIE